MACKAYVACTAELAPTRDLIPHDATLTPLFLATGASLWHPPHSCLFLGSLCPLPWTLISLCLHCSLPHFTLALLKCAIRITEAFHDHPIQNSILPLLFTYWK